MNRQISDATSPAACNPRGYAARLQRDARRAGGCSRQGEGSLKTLIKMALPPALFVATILTAGALISSNASASPLQTLLAGRSTAESSGGPQCSELMFFGVRGSSETSSQNDGYGPTIWSLKTALQALVPGMAAQTK